MAAIADVYRGHGRSHRVDHSFPNMSESSPPATTGGSVTTFATGVTTCAIS
jgi:hypothetical protein